MLVVVGVVLGTDICGWFSRYLIVCVYVCVCTPVATGVLEADRSGHTRPPSVEAC